MAPDGRFLYASNRGDDSIAAFRLSEDGRATFLERTSAHGRGPRNFCLSPDGRFALIANQYSGQHRRLCPRHRERQYRRNGLRRAGPARRLPGVGGRRTGDGELSPLYFARFDEKSDIWNFVPHAHDCFEALYFLYGNARIALPERSFYATFADVVVYPPGVLHTEHLQLDHHQEVYCLQFSAADLALREVLHCHDASGQIRLLLDGVAAEYAGGAADEDVLGCYVRTLSALLLRSLRAGPGKRSARRAG